MPPTFILSQDQTLLVFVSNNDRQQAVNRDCQRGLIARQTYDEFFVLPIPPCGETDIAWNRTTYVQQPLQYCKAEFSEPSNQIVKELSAASVARRLVCVGEANDIVAVGDVNQLGEDFKNDFWWPVASHYSPAGFHGDSAWKTTGHSRFPTRIRDEFQEKNN